MSAPSVARRSSGGRLGAFASSTVGKKFAMAVTGLIMAGFLVVHMTANLLAFAGPEHINAYARFLRSVPELLWLVRATLVVSVIVHATSAWQLARLGTAARPVDYEIRDPQIATIASRTIRWLSILLAMFIVIH